MEGGKPRKVKALGVRRSRITLKELLCREEGLQIESF